MVEVVLGCVVVDEAAEEAPPATPGIVKAGPRGALAPLVAASISGSCTSWYMRRSALKPSGWLSMLRSAVSWLRIISRIAAGLRMASMLCRSSSGSFMMWFSCGFCSSSCCMAGLLCIIDRIISGLLRMPCIMGESMICCIISGFCIICCCIVAMLGIPPPPAPNMPPNGFAALAPAAAPPAGGNIGKPNGLTAGVAAGAAAGVAVGGAADAAGALVAVGAAVGGGVPAAGRADPRTKKIVSSAWMPARAQPQYQSVSMRPSDRQSRSFRSDAAPPHSP